VLVALIVSGASGLAQTGPTTNPFRGNADAIQRGQGLYRARCANCHGMDARGVRGPDLTVVWGTAAADERIFTIVRQGIPGTEMPAANVRATDDDIWRTLAYLRTLGAQAPAVARQGNAENGEKIFWSMCGGCHRIDDRGGRLGPDLTRIGAARARAALERQIRGAVEDIRAGYEPVALTTATGQRLRGVKKNEDLFSVQIMDTRERIQGYNKSDLKDVADESRSAMPVYGPDRLNDSDMADLLQFLGSLKVAHTAVESGSR
jgi:putative heme-binding domain-containing protein